MGMSRAQESVVLSMYVRISLPGAHKCFKGPLNPLELYKNYGIMWICTLFCGEGPYLSTAFQKGLSPPKDENPLMCHISSMLHCYLTYQKVHNASIRRMFTRSKNTST